MKSKKNFLEFQIKKSIENMKKDKLVKKIKSMKS